MVDITCYHKTCRWRFTRSNIMTQNTAPHHTVPRDPIYVLYCFSRILVTSNVRFGLETAECHLPSVLCAWFSKCPGTFIETAFECRPLKYSLPPTPPLLCFSAARTLAISHQALQLPSRLEMTIFKSVSTNTTQHPSFSFPSPQNPHKLHHPERRHSHNRLPSIPGHPTERRWTCGRWGASSGSWATDSPCFQGRVR